jgi:glutamate formiminotransferase
VETEARQRGARVTGGELVGLVPERVLGDAAAAGVELPGIEGSRVLERALAQASL